MPELNRTLTNGMRMLEIMSSSMREYSVVELARHMGIPKSHSHRLLQTLVELGYVRRSEQTRKYSVDVRLLELASAIARGHPLRKRAGAVLRRLAEETGGTSVLSVWNRDRPLTIMSDAYSGNREQPFYEFGERLSLNTTATGKVFCAFLNVVPGAASFEAPTSESIVNPQTFQVELDQVRSRGYAISHEEGEPGVVAVAAPVWTPGQELEAVVGVAVYPGLGGQIADAGALVDVVMRAAQAVSI